MKGSLILLLFASLLACTSSISNAGGRGNWMIVEYAPIPPEAQSWVNRPIGCWLLNDVKVTDDARGLSWREGEKSFRLSSPRNWVMTSVNYNDYDTAAKFLRVDRDKCRNGPYPGVRSKKS